MTFVVVGGGPTGVELAGALGEIAHDTLRRDFRSIDPADARILLVEAMDRSCRPYPPGRRGPPSASSSGSASRSARRPGSSDIDERACASRRRRRPRSAIPARTVLWAAGVQASSLRPVGRPTAIGAETDRAGRVVVGPDLTIPGHPEIFVIGDAAVQPWKLTAGRCRAWPRARSSRDLRRRRRSAAPRRRAVRRSAIATRAMSPSSAGWPASPTSAGSGRSAARAGSGLAAVAGHPHRLPDRLRQPDRRHRPAGRGSS